MLRTVRRLPAAVRYHALHNGPAWQIYRSMRTIGRRVALREIRQAFDYAHDVLGGRRYAPWLITYTAVRGQFFEGWIPDNYYGDVVTRKLNQPYDLADAKSFSARVLPADVLPDLGYVIGGICYDRAYRPVDLPTFRTLLFTDHASVVLKLDRGWGGQAVFIVDRDGLDAALQRCSGRHAVVQQYLRQHPDLDSYGSGGITVRMTTTRELDGTIRLRASYLGIPAAGKDLVHNRDAFYLCLDPLDGTAPQDAINVAWQPVVHHPTSGARFRDIRVPGFTAAAELACRLHASLPHFGCIGWDFLIDTSLRPWLLEWNTSHNGISASEAVVGPNFRGLNWEHLHRRAAAPRG